MAMKIVIDKGKFLCLSDKSASLVVALRIIKIRNMARRIVSAESIIVLNYSLNITQEGR